MKFVDRFHAIDDNLEIVSKGLRNAHNAIGNIVDVYKEQNRGQNTTLLDSIRN